MQSDTEEKVENEQEPGTNRNANNGRKFFLRLPRAALYLAFIGVLERYAYNGCKCLLTIYMLEYFTYDQYMVIAIYHIFCGLASMFSGIFQMYCNSRTGKYEIILLSSMPYVAGYLMLTATSIVDENSIILVTSLFGTCLLCLAMGNGFVHTALVTFSYEQFSQNEREDGLGLYLVLYYFLRIVANLMAKYVSPTLRAEILCYGAECYAAAFGFQAIVIILFVLAFAAGLPFYVVLKTDKENDAVTSMKALFYGMICCYRGSFYHRISEKYSLKAATAVKKIIRAAIYFFYMNVFWALCNQQGSVWVIQGTKLNTFVNRNFDLKPEQMQLIFPLLALLISPLYHISIRPLMRRIRSWKIRVPIFLGGLCATASFVFAWYLQKTISFVMKGKYNAPDNYDPVKRLGQGVDTRISIFWQIPQYVMINFGEMLLLSTIMELFFGRFTDDTQSLGMALNHFAIGMGDFIVAIAYCFGFDSTTVLLGFTMLQFSLTLFHGVLSVFDILE